MLSWKHQAFFCSVHTQLSNLGFSFSLSNLVVILATVTTLSTDAVEAPPRLNLTGSNDDNSLQHRSLTQLSPCLSSSPNLFLLLTHLALLHTRETLYLGELAHAVLSKSSAL